MLDPQFYRMAYDDAKDLTEADVVSAAKMGKLPSDRALNPTEFIQQILSKGLIPADFDPLGYRINHPELWGSERADWEAALHYLKAGRPADGRWDRPFDPNFYSELYLPSVEPREGELLRAHKSANPSSYGSVEEALVRNGWRARDWVSGFDHQSYTVYNTLMERLHTPIQALVHFIELGWRELLAISPELEFDPQYYADLAGRPLATTPAETYRTWVENGYALGAPTNEAGHLRAMGLNIPCYPVGFDWRTYLEERPEACSPARANGRNANRWDALEHLVEQGILGGKFSLPITPEALSAILLAAADRFAIMGREAEATKCYERGLLFPNPPLLLLRHAADQAFRREQYGHALALYRVARASGSPGFWTWANGAKAALAVGELQEAADWVVGGLGEYPCNKQLLGILMEIQSARFEQAVARHLGALRAGRVETGIEVSLNTISDSFSSAHIACYGTEPPVIPKREGEPLRVVVLANKDLPQCTFYRVDLKEEQFRAAGGVDLQVFERSDDESFRSAAATAHVAIFYRLASNVDVLRSISACRAMNVLTVYEIDDLVFDPAAFPDALTSYYGSITAEQHFELRAGVALVRHAASSCDVAIASTEQLAKHLRSLVRSGSAVVHRNGFSAALAATATSSAQRPTLPDEAPFTIFYGSGTLAHGADFSELLVPALKILMEEFPKVCLLLCGHVDGNDLALHFPGRVEHVPPITDRNAYLSQMMSVDVNVAVLRPGAFNDCKSEIKWLEAAAFCVPSVVSDVKGFGETLIDGVHVVRVSADHQEWYRALRALVLDQGRRAAIGVAARNRALELYGPRTLGEGLRDSLASLASARNPNATSPTPRTRNRGAKVQGPKLSIPAQPVRRRILLSNVFFPPQAIGGATRVVRDQVSELVAQYSDRYEVGVLCGSDQGSVPYTTEAYAWRGVPVWSIDCPRREHMDWIPFDPLMEAPVDAVLETFKPDLVHAHCMQRLSATALERVKAHDIPYVVTAHDGWWVSDHQFFMDGVDKLRMPWDAEKFESRHNPHTRTESWARRLRLRTVLDSAAAVLTVSEAFASIYQRAGVAKAVAVPNGLPELPPLEPTAPANGRVRLAHLGGIVAHKGYFLLRQALVRGRFRNLDLLVTDHDMMPGEERQEIWGTTPVVFTGRVSQERVGALYGRFDILCALSLWPESYGLVAREALHYGKWVAASSRGAIGEDVVKGRNGWVVDVSVPEALEKVLREIDDNPLRFVRPPKGQRTHRTVAQQVADVAGVYAKVLAKGR